MSPFFSWLFSEEEAESSDDEKTGGVTPLEEDINAVNPETSASDDKEQEAPRVVRRKGRMNVFTEIFDTDKTDNIPEEEDEPWPTF